jgi:hypothetical protein
MTVIAYSKLYITILLPLNLQMGAHLLLDLQFLGGYYCPFNIVNVEFELEYFFLVKKK